MIKIFKNLVKDQVDCKISFLLKEESCREIICISICDSKYAISEDYDIDIANISDDISLPPLVVEESDVVMTFNMESKYFKRKIADIHGFSNTLIIRKALDGPLYFSYDKPANVNTKYEASFNDTTKINLKCYKNLDISQTTIAVGYVHPFSNAVIGDMIDITICESKKIVFHASMEKSGDQHLSELWIWAPTI